jgi:hypothetical protein
MNQIPLTSQSCGETTSELLLIAKAHKTKESWGKKRKEKGKETPAISTPSSTLPHKAQNAKCRCQD